MALLFDQTLPLGFNLEQNFGITGNRGLFGENVYAFSYQWSVQHQVIKDFDVFWQGFYNAAALPRLRNFADLEPAGAHHQNQNQTPPAVVTGVGAIWTVNDRLAIFGSYNFGLTSQFANPTSHSWASPWRSEATRRAFMKKSLSAACRRRWAAGGRGCREPRWPGRYRAPRTSSRRYRRA